MTSTPFDPPPPFDTESYAALHGLDGPPAADVTGNGIAHLRANPSIPRMTLAELSRHGRFVVEEREVAGPADSPEVALLICRPAGSKTRSAVYHIHGGGMISGDNRHGLDEVLDWAESLDLAVVSVEYRLAPEHPYPAPVDDCYAGLAWMVDHAIELDIDPDRIVIAGASAGGGLAAAVTLLARDRGGPKLIGQLLMCPMLDDRNDSASSRQMSGLGVWDREANAVGWGSYLGDLERDLVPVYASPARATDLSGLPATFIDVGSAETFRDECVDYADRIWLAGGEAELHVWPGGFHGYYAVAPLTRISLQTLGTRLDWLKSLLQLSAQTETNA